MKTEYEQVVSGEWFALDKDWKLACCECHLVHTIKIRVRNNKPEIRMDVDARATAALRRHHKLAIKRRRR